MSVDSEGFPNILKDYGGAEKDDNTELFQHKPVKTPALKKMKTGASTSSRTCESSGCFYLKDGRKLRITRGTLQSYIHLDQDFLVAISSNMADQVQQTHTETIEAVAKHLVKLSNKQDITKAISARAEVLKRGR